MAEHINNQQLLSSGGHRWIWRSKDQAEKSLLAGAGLSGAGSMVVATGARPGVIASINGSPAVLQGASDSELNDLETAIECLRAQGTIMEWEDDQGHTGSSLRILDYERVGERQMSVPSGAVWQYYRLHVADLDGAW